MAERVPALLHNRVRRCGPLMANAGHHEAAYCCSRVWLHSSCILGCSIGRSIVHGVLGLRTEWRPSGKCRFGVGMDHSVLFLCTCRDLSYRSTRLYCTSKVWTSAMVVVHRFRFHCRVTCLVCHRSKRSFVTAERLCCLGGNWCAISVRFLVGSAIRSAQACSRCLA